MTTYLNEASSHLYLNLPVYKICSSFSGFLKEKGRSSIMGRKQQGVMGRAFIIGTDRNGVCIAKQLLADPTLGLYPVGFIYQNDEYPNQEFTDLPIVGSPSMIECLVEEMDIDHLIIALSPEDSPNYYCVMEECLKTKAKIWKLPLFRSIDTGKLVQCSFNIH